MSARRHRRLVAGIGGLAVALLIGRARADAPSSADLVHTLGGEDVTKRYAAYSALIAKHPPDALPLLAKDVPGMPVAAQTFGLSIVQGYPPADSKPVLEHWLSTDAPYLQVAAGAVLLRQGDPKAAAVIVKALGLPTLEPGTLSLMIGQLNGQKDAKIAGAVRALVRAGAAPEILGAALHQLSFAPDDASVKAASALLAVESAGVRAIAAAFLVHLGDDAGTAPLATALASGNVAYLEFLQVRTLLSRTPRCPEKVLDALLGLLEAEPTGYSLSILIGVLSEFAYPKTVPVLQKLVDREDSMVARAAFEALSRIPGALTPDVTKALLTSKDEARRVFAAEALRRIDDLSGLPAVIDVLQHGTTARADAARALGTFHARGAVDPLIAALVDTDLGVRASAYSSVMSLIQFLFPYRRFDFQAAGYATNAAADVREAAMRRIKAWWEAHRDGSW